MKIRSLLVSCCPLCQYQKNVVSKFTYTLSLHFSTQTLLFLGVRKRFGKAQRTVSIFSEIVLQNVIFLSQVLSKTTFSLCAKLLRCTLDLHLSSCSLVSSAADRICFYFKTNLLVFLPFRTSFFHFRFSDNINFLSISLCK